MSILVVGANGGLSLGFITQFLSSPFASTHFGIYTVRSPTKAGPLSQLLRSGPKEHKYIILCVDLSSDLDIRTFCADLNKRISTCSIPPLKGIFHGAGVADTARQCWTEKDIERTFMVNYLSNFLLSLLLLESMDTDGAKVVFVGSTQMWVDWRANSQNYSSEEQKMSILEPSVKDMSRGEEKFKDYDVYKTGQRRYALSKLLCCEWMYEFQRRLDLDPKYSKVEVLGHDPGWVGGTGISRNAPFFVKSVLTIIWLIGHLISPFYENPLIRTAKKNGNDLVKVFFEKGAFKEGLKAKYVNGNVIDKVPEGVKDRKKQEELWSESLKLVELKDGEAALENWR